MKEDEGIEDKGVGVLLPVVLVIQVLLIALGIQPLERLQPLTFLSNWFSSAEESSMIFWILYADVWSFWGLAPTQPTEGYLSCKPFHSSASMLAFTHAATASASTHHPAHAFKDTC